MALAVFVHDHGGVAALLAAAAALAVTVVVGAREERVRAALRRERARELGIYMAAVKVIFTKRAIAKSYSFGRARS